MTQESFQEHMHEIHKMHRDYTFLINQGDVEKAKAIQNEIRNKHRAYYGLEPLPQDRKRKPSMLKHLWLLICRLSSKQP